MSRSRFRIAFVLLAVAVAVLATAGCGNTSESCCRGAGGAGQASSGRNLEEDVALAVYGSTSSGRLLSPRAPEEATRLSMVRSSPQTLQRLQAQAATVAPSPYRYTLASSSGGSIFVDDVMRVYHNGVEIFYGPGPGYNSGSFAPVAIDNVHEGDTIRIVATDLYPQCAAVSPLTLFRQDGQAIVVNATGLPFTCGGAQGVILDKTIEIKPEPSPGVRIEKLQPNPESFEPQASPGAGANTTTTITADVIKTELPDVTTGNYTLTIKPKSTASPPEEPPPAGKLALQAAADANPIDPPPFPSPPVPGPMVKTFTGAFNFTGDVATVNETWDGKSNSGSDFPDGECEVDLSVTVTDADGSATDDDTTIVTKGPGAPLLEVFHSNAQVASSIKNDAKQSVLLNKVLIPSSQTLLIRASDIKTNPPDKPKLQVRLKSRRTNPSGIPFILDRVGSGRYEGTFNQLSTLITPNPGGVETTFTVCDTGGDFDSSQSGFADSQAFIDSMKTRIVGMGMGKAMFDADATKILSLDMPNSRLGEVDFDYADAMNHTISSAQAAGYEAVQVEVTDSVTNLKQPPLRAALRIKNEANAFYYSGHGDHDGYLNLSNDASASIALYPANLTASWGSNLRTAIMAGCSVCDINDYNCMFPGGDPDALPSPQTTGFGWDRVVTGSGSRPAFLLGYNHQAPPYPKDIKVIEKFFFLLNTGVALGDPDQVARVWLEANAQTKNDNACAITQRGYYYISFREESLKLPGGGRLDSHHYKRRLLMIPRVFWQFPIPGATRSTHIMNAVSIPRKSGLPNLD